MKNKEKVIEKMIDKQKVCYIDSIDFDGFLNTKAMLRLRERNGISEDIKIFEREVIK